MHEHLSENKYFCPYCGEGITVIIEFIGQDQEYIEDCQVCCRPIVFRLSENWQGEQHVELITENDA